jgi:hypothetical protein
MTLLAQVALQNVRVHKINYFYDSTGHFWALVIFLSALILYTVGRTPSTEDKSDERTLPTFSITQTHNKHMWATVRRVGTEPTAPVFEWAKLL